MCIEKCFIEKTFYKDLLIESLISLSERMDKLLFN